MKERQLLVNQSNQDKERKRDQLTSVELEQSDLADVAVWSRCSDQFLQWLAAEALGVRSAEM